MNKKIFSILVLIFSLVFGTQAFASLTFTSNAITGTTSSAIDLGSGTLSLQTTGNSPITTGTGLFTAPGGISSSTLGIGPLASAGIALSTTQSSEDTYNYAWKGITADTSAADFGLILDGTPFFTGTSDSARDNSLIFGYNPGSQNTPPVSTEPSLTWTVESHYVNNTPAPDTHWLESYWQYVKPAASSGSSFRPITLNVNRATTASTMALNADKTLIQSADASNVYLGVQPSSNQVYVGINTTLDAVTNNTPFLRQKNNAGTGWVNLAHADTAGFVTLGGGTGYGGVSVLMGAYGGLSVPAGTTATYHYPLAFTSGNLNTTPTAGAVEYKDPDFFMTPTGTDRGSVALVTKGTTAPATTPTAVGRIYVDTNTAKVYISTGTTSSADWTLLN